MACLIDTQRELKPRTIDTALQRLRAWLGEWDKAIYQLTPRDVQSMHTKRRLIVSADTEHGELSVLKRFADWANKHSLLDGKTLKAISDLKSTRKKKRGKKQLRIDEARILIKTLVRAAQPGDSDRLSVCRRESVPLCIAARVTGERDR